MRVIVLIICIAIIFSCSNNYKSKELVLNTDYKTIQIPSNPKEITNYSEIIDEFTYIKLETNPKCLIGNVESLIITDDYIIVPDNFQKKSVNIFNTQGTYQSTINKVGKGPGEYIFPYIVIHDPINNGIMIFDSGSLKYIWYSIDGEYIKSIQSNIFPSVIGTTENNYYVIHLSNKYSSIRKKEIKNGLLILDSNFNPIKYLWPKISISDGILSDVNKMIPINDKVYFTPQFCDTIYSIKGQVVKPAYVIKFQNSSLDYLKVLKTTSIPELFKEIHRDDITYRYYRSYVLSNKIILFSYLQKEKRHDCLYSETGNISKFFIMENLIDDIYGLFKFNPITCFKDRLIIINEPYQIIKRAEKLKNRIGTREFNKLLNNKPQLKDLLSNLSKDDNPVLVFCKLKMD